MSDIDIYMSHLSISICYCVVLRLLSRSVVVFVVLKLDRGLPERIYSQTTSSEQTAYAFVV